MFRPVSMPADARRTLRRSCRGLGVSLPALANRRPCLFLRRFIVAPERHPERAIELTANDRAHAIRLGSTWLGVPPSKITVAEPQDELRSEGRA